MEGLGFTGGRTCGAPAAAHRSNAASREMRVLSLMPRCWTRPTNERLGVHAKHECARIPGSRERHSPRTQRYEREDEAEGARKAALPAVKHKAARAATRR